MTARLCCIPITNVLQPCGYVVDETHYEYIPGSVAKEIDQCPGAPGGDNGSGMQPFRQYIRAFQLAISDRITDLMDLTGYTRWRRKRDDEDPDRPRDLHRSNDVEMQQQAHESTKYLFTCVTICGRQMRTKMIPLSIMATQNDRTVFCRLRKEYRAIAGFWRRLLGLKRVCGIRFVQVSKPIAAYKYRALLTSKVVPRDRPSELGYISAFRAIRFERRGSATINQFKCAE